MAHTNTSIYIDKSTTPNKGVEIADIQAVLGLSNNDIGGLITQGVAQTSINKWAKYKPIHYPGKFKLDDADFRGRQTEYNDHGLIYGLKVPSQISVISPSAFHATSWDYLGYPNATGLSGTSMYRFLDFDGYSSTAVANIYGNIPSTSQFYIGTTVAICSGFSAVEEGFRVNNTNGVDLARFVVGLSPDDSDDVLKQRLTYCYPAILIGNYLTGVGVYNPTTGQVDYKTMATYNGGYVISSPNWCVDMTKVDEQGNAPWTSNTNTVATLVLVYTGLSNPYLINGDTNSDLTQYWFDMTQERAWTARIFPLPGACGVPVAITRYAVGYTVTPTSATGTSTTLTVYFSVSFDGTTSADGYVDITVAFGRGQQQATTRRLLRVTDTSGYATFSPSDFGKTQFMPLSDSHVYVDALAYPPSEGHLVSADFNVTY